MKRSQGDGSAQNIIGEECDKLPDTLVSSLWVFSFERYSLRCNCSKVEVEIRGQGKVEVREHVI